MSFIYNMSDLWNAGATTFTAIKMNVTDTASASASLLLDLQVGGVSKFSVGKDGLLTVNYPTSGTGVKVVGNGNGFIASSFGTDSTGYGGYGPRLQGDNTIEWSATANGIPGGSLILSRAAAASLRLGAPDAAAPVAQTLGVQSVVAGTSNTAGANFTIRGSAGTGTGAGGSIIFQVAPAGGSGTAQNAFATALTIDSTKTLLLANNSTSSPGIQFAVSGGYYVSYYASQYAVEFGIASAIGAAPAAAYGTLKYAVNTKELTFGAGSSASAVLAVDAANTLALRNGTSAQTFRVYETYTDASNYRRAAFADGIYAEGAGTGLTGAGLNIYNRDNGPIYFATNNTLRWTISAAGHLLAQTDNTYDIGAAGANRPRAIYVAGQALFGGNAGFTAGGNLRMGSSYGYIIPNADGVWQFSNFAATDFNRIQLGGTTSSFPALKRNSTALETKLADDSAYAPHAMQYLDVTDGITAPASATGRARIYVDTADGDLKVIFADGTVKTIVTDT